MNKTKTLVIKKVNISVISQFIALTGIATVAPLIGHQIITGSIVNAALFISVVLLGIRGAVLIALVPSLIALTVGLLPSALAPMIPFIVFGNVILILVFACLKQKNYWLAMISASFIKFIFLFSVSSVVVNLLFQKEIAQSIAIMMSWPQLLTALIGGLIAYLFLMKRINNKIC
ncbi:MAG: iron hydrogenase [Parcubacteria group bacterium]|nr:iron hydrogenase [Parcubacteria group bacterium]